MFLQNASESDHLGMLARKRWLHADLTNEIVCILVLCSISIHENVVVKCCNLASVHFAVVNFPFDSLVHGDSLFWIRVVVNCLALRAQGQSAWGSGHSRWAITIATYCFMAEA